MQLSQWITLDRLKSNKGRRNYCSNVMFIGWATQSDQLLNLVCMSKIISSYSVHDKHVIGNSFQYYHTAAQAGSVTCKLVIRKCTEMNICCTCGFLKILCKF